MSIRHRFFTADATSPLVVKLNELRAARVAAFDTIKAFLDKIGASAMYGNSPATYKFDFDGENYDKLDMNVWCKTKPHRGTFYLRPRKNTPGGKALAAEIKELPAFPDYSQALSTIPDLPYEYPVVVYGNKWYQPFIKYWNHVTNAVLVSVPWRDYTAAEIAEYKAQDNEWSLSKDFGGWVPADWLKEMKEWEALKLIEDDKIADPTVDDEVEGAEAV